MGMRDYSRRDFLKGLCAGAVAATAGCGFSNFTKGKNKSRPNIFFAIADDWSWPHASIAGDKVIKTPTFDRTAREGVLFINAFVTAPSCSPSRSSILTGQWHWRLEEGANLWGFLPARFEVYPDLLEENGYCVGFTGKGWGPGRNEHSGRKRNPAGPSYKDFKEFLNGRPKGKPFCFWFGSTDPHRPYEYGSGVKSGMKLEDVEVPAPLADSKEVRVDICDYYFEVERFDRQVGEMLKILEEAGELDNTLVVITGDNGMPFPRCKSNLYDLGTHVPLAVRWPRAAKAGRIVEDFVSLADLAPTFLEAAGLKPTAAMTGKSFLDILTSGKSGQVDKKRSKVFTGKERHARVRKNNAGYPMRAVRTKDFLYIRNFEPDRWPAGDVEGYEYNDPPAPYGDVDMNSPTKDYMMAHRVEFERLFELGFGKRGAEELYDLKNDPEQLSNVASQAEYSQVKERLAAVLTEELKSSKDPRIMGGGAIFESYPYFGGYWRKKNPQNDPAGKK